MRDRGLAGAGGAGAPATSRNRDAARAKEADATGRLFFHGAHCAVVLPIAVRVGVATSPRERFVLARILRNKKADLGVTSVAGVTAVDIDLLHLWRVMWWGVRGPLLLLLVMIVYTLTVATDRVVRYYAARSQSNSFARQASQALVEGALTPIVSIAQNYRKSPIAAMLVAALENLRSLAPNISDAEAIPAARRALKNSAVNLHAELRQGLNGLATVATVAPLLGMFGTVFHLAFGAFPGCTGQKSMCEAAEASGVGDSLLFCVLGAFVGVLAMWWYRYFSRRVEDFDAEMNHSSQTIIHALLLHPAWLKQFRA